MAKPKIRFKGFTDDWEQRKLEDYIVEYHEVTTESNQYPALTSSRKGIFLQTEYFAGNQIASEDNTGYNVVPYGYFTYRHMSDDEIFHFNINDIVENGIVSTLYPVFTTTEELDSRYLQYQLNHGHEFARFAVLQKQGGSRTYMYLSKLKQLSLTMPKTVDEQKQISVFFMELDHLITLHQRKCEETKKLKKYMLQKMFPQNGQKVPEIRFSGFTDDWEQRKLGDLIREISTGKSVNSDEGIVGADNIGVLKTSCVSYDHFDPSESKPVVKDERHLVKCAVEGDSVIVSRMNTPERVGACGYVERSFPNLFLPDRLWKLKFQENVNTYFLYTMLVSGGYKEKITSMASGTSGSMYNIPKDAFLNLRLALSLDIDEQKKIGDYFKQLDHLITLHQRKNIYF